LNLHLNDFINKLLLHFFSFLKKTEMVDTLANDKGNGSLGQKLPNQKQMLAILQQPVGFEEQVNVVQLHNAISGQNTIVPEETSKSQEQLNGSQKQSTRFPKPTNILPEQSIERQGQSSGHVSDEILPSAGQLIANRTSVAGHSIFDADTTGSTIAEQSTNVVENSEGETFTVDVVLGHRQEDDGTKSYLVRWDGFGNDHNSWEPPTCFMDATPVSEYLWRIIDDFNEKLNAKNAK
jgi:hypothetical protein